jgi:small subunit ribosomal protein S14
MAKKGKIQHNMKRQRLVDLKRAKRLELREKSIDLSATPEERMDARMQLAKLPRNSSEIRLRNRCELSGRPRGFVRKFRLSRIALRELALRGLLPGVTKSSW